MYVFSWRHRTIIWTSLHAYTQSINTYTPLKIGQIFTWLPHFQVNRPENKDRHKRLIYNTSFHKGSIVTVLVCAGALFVGLDLCQVGLPCTVLDIFLVCILLFLLFVGGQWKYWQGYWLPDLLQRNRGKMRLSGAHFPIQSHQVATSNMGLSVGLKYAWVAKYRLNRCFNVTNMEEENNQLKNAWYLCGGPCQKCVNHAQFILYSISVSLYSVVSFPDHIICGLELDYLLAVSYRSLERLKLT